MMHVHQPGPTGEVEMGLSQGPSALAFVSNLGMPAWTCDSEGRVVSLNARAEGFLGRRAPVCVGQPCFRVVGGWTESGRPHCREDCPVLDRVRRGRAIEPFTLGFLPPIPGEGVRWALIIVIPVTPAGGGAPWLVHCAADVGRAHRLQEYMEHVASRSGTVGRCLADAQLTGREEEILEGLARDADSHELARHLHVSYATVRNHVQHILTKLGVHSIQEAVAVYLLRPE